MKKIIVLFVSLICFTSCRQTEIEKPDNLIREDKMVDILYDLSLLEAIKSTNYSSIEERKINLSDYIYKKYNIDSLQFVKSDRYYASDPDGYRKLYKKVSERIEKNKKATDSLAKILPKAVGPQEIKDTPPLKKDPKKKILPDSRNTHIQPAKRP